LSGKVKKRSGYQFILLGVIVFCLANCGLDNLTDENKPNFPVDTSIVKMIESNLDFQNLFELEKTVKLETNNNCLINDITEVLFLEKEKRIVVLDSEGKNIFIFDLLGNFISKLGRRGKGENEYNKLYSIQYCDNKIYVFSYPKIFAFNIDGSFSHYSQITMNEKSFYVHKMHVQRDTIIAYENDNWSVEADLILYSMKENRIIETFGNGTENYTFSVQLFEKFNDNNFLFSGAFVDRINKVNIKTGSIEKFAKLNPSKLPSQLLEIKDENNMYKWVFENIEKLNELSPYNTLNGINNFFFLSRVVPGKGLLFDIFDKNGSHIKSVDSYSMKVIHKNMIEDDSFGINFSNNKLVLSGVDSEKGEDVNPVLFICSLKKN